MRLLIKEMRILTKFGIYEINKKFKLIVDAYPLTSIRNCYLVDVRIGWFRFFGTCKPLWHVLTKYKMWRGK